MDLTDAEMNQPLLRTIRMCKRLSTLCNAVFAVIILWLLFVLIFYVVSSLITSDTNGLAASIPMLLSYIAYGILFSLIPLLVGKMFKDISENGTPFTLKNARRLLYLSLILVCYALFGPFLDFIESQIVFSSESIEFAMGGFNRDFSSSAGTTFDLFPLVIAAAFFALSYVFKYGVLLQQESDETL